MLKIMFNNVDCGESLRDEIHNWTESTVMKGKSKGLRKRNNENGKPNPLIKSVVWFD